MDDNNDNNNDADNDNDNNNEEIIIENTSSQIENNDNINAGNGALSVLSYNIFIRPPFIVNNFNSDHKTERLKGIKEHVLPNYDIVCFQELFRMFSFRASDLLATAETLGFKAVASEAKWSQLMVIDGGCVTLTKLPIQSSDAITYPPGVNSDRLAAKGAVYVHCLKSIEGSDKTFHFHVFNTHLQASYDFHPSNVKNEEIRDTQFAHLRNFITSKIQNLNHSEKNNVILLCGDLNVDARKSKENGLEHSEGYTKMMEKLSIDGFVLRDLVYEKLREHPITVGDGIEVDGKLIPRETKLTNSNDYLCRKRLDYIILFERADAKVDIELLHSKVEPFFVENKPYTQLSDHYGVSASLII